MSLPPQTNRIVLAVRLALIVAAIASAVQGNWSAVFVSALTLVLTFGPRVFADRFDIRLPIAFSTAIVLFLFATLFLGEVFDFYERYWWWDVALHGGSAVGFGLVGTLMVLMLFEGDRFAAPPLAVAALAWCFAVSIGVLWEIFEFAMDQAFGLNMQKSGLIDTMWDLIVDAIGASIGATGGYFYLKGSEQDGLSGLVAQFVAANRRLYQRARNRRN